MLRRRVYVVQATDSLLKALPNSDLAELADDHAFVVEEADRSDWVGQAQRERIKIAFMAWFFDHMSDPELSTVFGEPPFTCDLFDRWWTLVTPAVLGPIESVVEDYLPASRARSFRGVSEAVRKWLGRLQAEG